MKKVGENDEKPVYSGWFAGEEKFLYWAWDRQSNPTNAYVRAVPGNWFFGTTIGDVVNAISSSTTYGLRYCPTDQEVEWFHFGTSMASTLDIETAVNQFVSMTAGQGNYNDAKPFECCRGFNWTIDGDVDNVVRMQIHNGSPWEMTDGRHYYKGQDKNGVKYFLYFLLDEDDEDIPRESRSGRWYVGSTPGDRKSFKYVTKKSGEFIRYRNGFDLCPNDPAYDLWMGKIPDGPTAFNFKCTDSSSWSPVTTCDNAGDWLFNGPWAYEQQNGKNRDICQLDMVVQELVGKMKDQLIFHRPDGQHIIRKTFPKIVNAIKQLTDKECMRTIDDSRLFVKGCTKVCDAIKDIPFPGEIAPVFGAIMKTFYASISTWEKDYKLCAEEFNNLKSGINGLDQFTGMYLK